MGLSLFWFWCEGHSGKAKLTPICLTIAVFLGSAACAPNSGQGPVIASDAVSEKPKSGLEVSSTKPELTLWSELNLRSPAKVVKQAIGKKAILLKQNKSWIQIRFEGENLILPH